MENSLRKLMGSSINITVVFLLVADFSCGRIVELVSSQLSGIQFVVDDWGAQVSAAGWLADGFV